MTKQLQKADKLVTKATSVFGDAVIQVEKANEILRQEIGNDSQKILDIEDQIVGLRRLIDSIEVERSEKSLKVVSNDGLLQQLKNFVPQT
jgi:hypothetical protein